MTHTFEENVFLGLMVALVVGIAAMLMFSDADTAKDFNAKCQAAHGQAVWNGKYWECLK